MAVIANISLTDATPAAVVFTPRKADPENSVLVKRGYVAANDSALADTLISLGVSPSSAKRPTSRIKFSLTFPNPEYLVTDEAPMSTARAFFEVVVPDDFSVSARQHLYALIDSFVQNANVQSAIEDDEGMY